MAGLLGTVTAIEPFAQYQGKVYTQLVEVELEEEFKYWLFDYDMFIEEDNLSDEIEITLGLVHNTSDWTRNPEAIPNIDPNGGKKSTNHEYTGEIVSKITEEDTNGIEVVIDVGYGTVATTISESDQVKEGDIITITMSRSTISSIE